MDQDTATVIPFPLHRRSTIEETLAGFPGWTDDEAGRGRRTERRVTVLFADLRGWDSVASRVGHVPAARLLSTCVAEAISALREHGAAEVTCGGDTMQPVVSARFEGGDHAYRALLAAVDMRLAIGHLQLADLPGYRFQVCTGVSTGRVVDASLDSGARVAFQAVGTMRMFAGRLQEFAGPGQIFLSAGTFGDVAGRAAVRPIGEVRTNPDGDREEAYCLSDLVPAALPAGEDIGSAR